MAERKQTFTGNKRRRLNRTSKKANSYATSTLGGSKFWNGSAQAVKKRDPVGKGIG